MADTSTARGDDKLVMRATALTVMITAAGAALGLARDLLLAGLFGATAATDAFLVAWTLPETASTLLLDGGIALLVVPLFVRAAADGSALRDVAGAALPRLAALLSASTALLVLAAPALVRLLAPGLADPGLATAATRIAGLTILLFGLAGYLGAGLRSQHIFGVPALVYPAYNVGIIAAMLLLGGRIGVLAAAVGVAAGALLMIAVQLPTFLRRIGMPRWRPATPVAALAWGAVAPVMAFLITRQAQVFVERFFGSTLDPGTISHLNYAQKIAQLPMALAVMLATVSFPLLARSVASGDTAASRRRTEWDLRVVCGLTLLAAAYLWAFAPEVVAVLFQRGAFTSADVTATAGIMRVYVLGLAGHAAVTVLSRCYFTGQRPMWMPAVAMGAGLATTVVISAAALGSYGSAAIAAANAAGISLTALLLVVFGRGGAAGIRLPRVVASAAGLWLAAAAAGAAGWSAGQLLTSDSALVVAAAGAPVVLGTFALAAAVATRLAPGPAPPRPEPAGSANPPPARGVR